MKRCKYIILSLAIILGGITFLGYTPSHVYAATCTQSSISAKFSDGLTKATPNAVKAITDKISVTTTVEVECNVQNPTGWTAHLSGPTKQGDTENKKDLKVWTISKWDSSSKQPSGKYLSIATLNTTITPFTGTPAAAKYNFKLTGYNNKLSAITDGFSVTYGTVAPTNTPTNTPTNNPSPCTGTGCGTTTVGDFDKSVGSLINPINVDTFPELVLFVMKGFIFLIGVMAVVIIIIGGVRMVLSQGNQESITKGKQTVIWAVAGLIVALLSFSMVSIVQNLLGQ